MRWSDVTTSSPRRGEIWWVDWSPGRGSEQAGRRPALIVQRDAANTNDRYPNTIVAAISTKGRLVSAHVSLEPTPTNGLSAQSFVKCEQLFTISKERLGTRVGKLTPQQMSSVSRALQVVLDL
jgi:mRNA interferase MazF